MLRNLFVISAVLAVPAAAQTTIETISFWDGVNQVTSFGKPNTATYGQTFTVPASDNVLQSFSFFLRDLSGTGDLQFQGYVAKWYLVPEQLTGPVLFQSAVRTGPTGAGFTRFDFDVGGISLTSGISTWCSSAARDCSAAFPARHPWRRGAFSRRTLTDTSAVSRFPTMAIISTRSFRRSGPPSTRISRSRSSSAKLEPSTVPEPSTVVLMGTGLGILLLGVARRKRRS